MKMETPQNKKIRPQRTPTPKMSARKKALFERERQSPIRESENETLFMGIAPLSPDTKENIVEECNRNQFKVKVQKSKKNLEVEMPLRNSQKLDSNIIDKNNSPRTSSRKIDFLDGSPRRSLRIHTAKETSEALKSPSNTKLNSQENTPNTPKTFTPSTDELQVLFNNTLNFKQKKDNRNIFDENSVSSSDEETYKEKQKEVEQLYPNISHKITKKRANSKEIESEPRGKIPRITLTPPNPSTSPMRPVTTSIPTKSFYSRISASMSPQSSSTSSPFTKHFKSRRHISFKNHSNLSSGINKGVRHKIRRNTKKKNLIKTSVEDILKTIRSDKFKFLPSKRVFNEKLKEVHEILNSSDDPIKRARPLNIQPDDSVLHDGFSNSEGEENGSDNEIVPIEQEHAEVNEGLEAPISKRKFFKSGSHVVKNQYKLTNNIKATVTNGKLSILPSKKKKRSSKTKSKDEIFSVEQRAIDDIIQKLDAVTEEPFISDKKCVVKENKSISNFDTQPSQQTDVDKFAHFRARIPYKTSDPEMIEQQQLLLDFLIANQICTEENFKIFITDPENHQAEAAQIVDSLVVVVAEEDGPLNNFVEHYEEVMTTAEDEVEQFRNMLPYNTNDPNEAERQVSILNFLISNQICTEENFKIFIADPEDHKEEAALVIDNLVKVTSGGDSSNEQKINATANSDLRMDVEETTTLDLIETLQNENIEPNRNSSPKNSSSANLFPIFYPGKIKPIMQQSSRKQQNRWNRGVGANQYQIDAGQKEFGAKQCSKCGLVYTVHEPEEEKLHQEYHSNSHVLKFKGWIDEDAVMEFPEWGSDGRIIKITNSAHPKRRERVAEVLKLVDQELGFSSYIFPANYVVFFAIRKQHIVGFCLVQPLEKANRYVCSNGVDCCTEEDYPAKCGISRIWVAPFHRRLRIASKLIKAVQLHTILGENISIDNIAFSAPTDNGKAFAQAISKRKDFLVYQ